MDSDDEYLPGYLAKVELATTTWPDAVFVGAAFYDQDKEFRKVSPRKPYGKLTDDGFFLAGTFIIKRKLFLMAGGYDPVMKYSENTELAIRLSPILVSKVFIEEFMLKINQQFLNRVSHSPDNVILSLKHVLAKHTYYYRRNSHIKWLYLNILGVSFSRLGNKREAAMYFWKSVKLKPWGWKSYFRLLRLLVPSKA